MTAIEGVNCRSLLAADGAVLMRVNPPFDVGPAKLGKGSTVRDAALYGEGAFKLRQADQALGLRIEGGFASPITGGDGNREFFIWMDHEQNP